MNVSVLARAAGLFFMFSLNIGSPLDGFTVSDFLWHRLHLNAKAILQLCHDDVQLHFALSAQQCLMGFIISLYHKGRVFFSQSRQRSKDFILILFVYRLNGHIKRWRREVQRQIADNIIFITERVPGQGMLQFRHRYDISRFRVIQFLLFFPAKEEQFSQFFHLPSPVV